MMPETDEEGVFRLIGFNFEGKCAIDLIGKADGFRGEKSWYRVFNQ